jgi:hypothetical protein
MASDPFDDAQEVAEASMLREPTAAESAAFAAARVAHDQFPVRPNYDIELSDTVAKFEARHSDAQGEACLLAQTVGSRSDDFTNVAVSWILEASRQRGQRVTSVKGNAALAAVAAFEPRNEAETMMAAQAFATHDLAMEMLSRAKSAQFIEQTQQYVSMATKLSRTFTAHMEAFAKLKRGGEQIVRHIHVDNRGGQTVIAETVNTGGRANGVFDGQPHTSGDELVGSAALPRHHEAGNGVPITGGKREEALPHARREESGSAERKSA